MSRTQTAVTVAVAAAFAVSGLAAQAPEGRRGSITDVPGIKVGHAVLAERPTGCTVVLAEGGAVAGVDVRGSAPGTIETDVLDPVNLVQHVQAVFLSGGSAFGLDVATGVRRYLYERKIGFQTRVARVPIVPGAIIFDLAVGGRPDVWPGADCGYRASASATVGPVAEGNAGAGAGATVGKLGDGAMKGGLGTASISVAAGGGTLVVGAIAVVNALGDIIDPTTGALVAGARTPDGKAMADARTLLRRGRTAQAPAGQNTTIAVVATNARLTKVQATKVAQMAHDGMARAIYPAHTMSDGDAIFALSTGELAVDDVTRIGALAADAVMEAILRGVRAARSIPGYPAAGDLR